MRRIISIVAAIMIVAIMGSAFATSENQITFRGLNWYEKYVDANKQVDLGKGYVMDSSRYLYDIDGGYFVTLDDNLNIIEGMGFRVKYNNVEVAGYDAEPSIYFIYSISNGTSVSKMDEAILYMAGYRIGGYSNLDSVYLDLEKKLTSIYGKGESKKEKYFDEKSTKWNDENGNELSLALSGYGYVEILYAAAGHKERLEEIREVRLAEKYKQYKQEEEELEKKAGNVSGL